jgi:TrmH family RNA methyltransferase
MSFRVQPISSPANPGFKQALLLAEKSRERRKTGLAVVEGLKEIRLALAAGCKLQSLWFCSRFTRLETLDQWGFLREGAGLFDLEATLFSRLAYRDDTENAVAVVVAPAMEIAAFHPHKKSLLVVEGVEKPGNLGAIFRSADASGIGGIIVCDPAADLLHPNVIRASLGCVFKVPGAVCSSEEAIEWLQGNGFRLMTTYMDTPGSWTSLSLEMPVAVAVGTEATGLGEIWRGKADGNLRIPMCGEIDSLNVSTAAALIMYEMLRQQEGSRPS